VTRLRRVEQGLDAALAEGSGNACVADKEKERGSGLQSPSFETALSTAPPAQAGTARARRARPNSGVSPPVLRAGRA